MERRFQYYVPFTNHTQYVYRTRARAREHNNTMQKLILNYTRLRLNEAFLESRIVMSCSRCVDSVNILILWLRSIYLVAFEASNCRRSIFSKNHKSSPCRGEHIRTYISGSRCTWWQKTTNRHTHKHVGQPQ